MTKQRMTVQDAAETLGISVDAIRQRVRRGKLNRARPPEDDDKRVYVWLDLNQTENGQESSQDETESRQGVQGQGGDELLESYRDQIEWLRREVERKDTIIMSLTQRVPELEIPRETYDGAPVAENAAAEGHGASEAAAEGTNNDNAPDDLQEPAQQRSWLLRWFGF